MHKSILIMLCFVLASLADNQQAFALAMMALPGILLILFIILGILILTEYLISNILINKNPNQIEFYLRIRNRIIIGTCIFIVLVAITAVSFPTAIYLNSK